MGSARTEAKKRQNKRRKFKIRMKEIQKTRKYRSSYFLDITPLCEEEIFLFFPVARKQ